MSPVAPQAVQVASEAGSSDQKHRRYNGVPILRTSPLQIRPDFSRFLIQMKQFGNFVSVFNRSYFFFKLLCEMCKFLRYL